VANHSLLTLLKCGIPSGSIAYSPRMAGAKRRDQTPFHEKEPLDAVKSDVASGGHCVSP
jgi:hypothetical protein